MLSYFAAAAAQVSRSGDGNWLLSERDLFSVIKKRSFFKTCLSDEGPNHLTGIGTIASVSESTHTNLASILLLFPVILLRPTTKSPAPTSPNPKGPQKALVRSWYAVPSLWNPFRQELQLSSDARAVLWNPGRASALRVSCGQRPHHTTRGLEVLWGALRLSWMGKMVVLRGA